jgi:hypothetical protein
MFAMIRGEEPT